MCVQKNRAHQVFANAEQLKRILMIPQSYCSQTYYSIYVSTSHRIRGIQLVTPNKFNFSSSFAFAM